MDRSTFLYKTFLEHFSVEPTPCQDRLFHTVADFAVGDDADILVVNGYAGTGKTTAMAAVINAFRELKTRSILLAPTGRSAKVFSGIAGLICAYYLNTSAGAAIVLASAVCYFVSLAVSAMNCRVKRRKG